MKKTKETSNEQWNKWLNLSQEDMNIILPKNKKQFVEFSSKHFEAYFDKFSEEDKARMIHLSLCRFYQDVLTETFEQDTEFSHHIKEVLKDLFNKVK